jgi:hypothetical protein
MQKNKLNKKGNFIDIPVVLITLLVLGVFGLILTYTQDKMFEGFVNKTIEAGYATNESASTLLMNEQRSTFPKIMDYGFLIFAVMFIFFSYIMARQIPSNNSFWALIIIFNIIVWGLAVLTSYLYERIANYSTYFSEIVPQMYFTNIILSNMLFYALIYSFVIGVALYAKEN